LADLTKTPYLLWNIEVFTGASDPLCEFLVEGTDNAKAFYMALRVMQGREFNQINITERKGESEI